jgi:hypothetical protein
LVSTFSQEKQQEKSKPNLLPSATDDAVALHKDLISIFVAPAQQGWEKGSLTHLSTPTNLSLLCSEGPGGLWLLAPNSLLKHRNPTVRQKLIAAGRGLPFKKKRGLLQAARTKRGRDWSGKPRITLQTHICCWFRAS